MKTAMLVLDVALTASVLVGCNPDTRIEGDTSVDSTPDVVHDGFVELPWDGTLPPDTASWECLVDADCDDSDPCTTDACEGPEHGCAHLPLHGSSLIGPDVRLTWADGLAFGPRIAWTGSGLGVAWVDGRISGCTDLTGLTFCQDHPFFARFDLSGATLGSQAPLTDSPDGWTSVLDTIWTGSRYAIGWSEQASDGGATSPHLSILDEEGIAVAAGSTPSDAVGVGQSPRIVQAGDVLAMLWVGVDDDFPEVPGRIHLTAFDQGGLETSTTIVYENTDGAFHESPHPVWTGSSIAAPFAVDSTSSLLLFVSPDGAANELRTYTGDATWNNARTVWTGSEIALVWSGDDVLGPPYDSEMHFRRLSPAGDEIGDRVQLTDDTPSHWFLDRVAWTGSEILVTWITNNGWEEQGWLTRLSPEGVRLADDFAIPANANHAWTGSEIALVWSDDRTGDWELYMNRVGWCE